MSLLVQSSLAAGSGAPIPLPVTQGGTGTTTSTGTGSVVLNTSPTLIGPILGDSSASTISVSGIITGQSGRVIAVRVVTAAGAVTVTVADDVVVVKKTVGAATAVTLPVVQTTGQRLTIKDGKGDAASNNITISPTAGNIDGSATLVMSTNYQAVRLVYNGTEWSVI